MLTTTTYLSATLWTRKECAEYLSISMSTFYKRYPKMIEMEGAPKPCTGNIRGSGARWLPQDWINWAARRNQPIAVETTDNSAWSPEFAALLQGSTF